MRLKVRKLRWNTLGLQFDWSKRGYNISLPHNKIPDALSQPAKKMTSPTMPVGEDFQPEAAIVNYFGSGMDIDASLLECLPSICHSLRRPWRWKRYTMYKDC
ncbi:alpha-ketoglutarate-dependent dioxygenase alkB [Artemisia annua]|uniref:Alpha-ketoglutarate-dependent dioxygenase alkB n=1 Tax=Artemisia annua TaxID=35608 RepID=A0A2U1MTW3_ARTAN|nr:alpha-ketoglutarate-dependent dioxygenase alkB [Artemisia annua]